MTVTLHLFEILMKLGEETPTHSMNKENTDNTKNGSFLISRINTFFHAVCKDIQLIKHAKTLIGKFLSAFNCFTVEICDVLDL